MPILKTIGIYNGLKPKASPSKAQLQQLASKLQGAWQKYLEQRRITGTKIVNAAAELHSLARRKTSKLGSERQAAIKRLT